MKRRPCYLAAVARAAGGLPMKSLCILAVLLMSVFPLHSKASAEEKSQVVRLAKLQIDSGQLEAYKVALKEEIETSVRVEPGVVSLSAVSEKDHPERITILEIYADQAAYEAHLKAPHFTKYKTSTQAMIKSLDLLETVPVALAAKAR